MHSPADEFEGVKTNPDRIDSLVRLLRSSSIPRDQEEVELTGLTRIEAGNFWLAIVAICHQTSPLGLPPLRGFIDGRDVRGWDFLVAAFWKEVQKRRVLLDPEVWVRASTKWIVDTFGSDMSEPTRRAELIRDLGQVMLREGWPNFEFLFNQSRGQIATGSTPLLNLLRHFQAYQDPVLKKSYFLLSLMQNSCGWKYSDPENLGPPVDYHEIRGHLRVGTVVITDFRLRDQVANGRSIAPAHDIEIRKAVRAAIVRISNETGIRNPSILHYMFWNVFRSVCTRISPNCDGTRHSPLPTRYREMNDEAKAGCCPFREACAAYAEKHFSIMEYSTNTEFY